MGSNIANDAEGSRFDYHASHIGQCRHRLATDATFLRSCIVQVLSRDDGPRHLSHV